MNRLLSTRAFLAAAVAFGSLGAVSAAHARTDLAVSIGVPLGNVYSAPVYVQPRSVYVQPQPVYYGSRRDGRILLRVTAARESPERIVLVAFEEDLPQRPPAVCLVEACRTG